jgi:hypothetical protein
MSAEPGRALVPATDEAHAVLRAEARRLREEARARYGEVDLLVAALRDHVRDLQHERDRLLSELARMRDDARRRDAAWLPRGTKPNR